MSWLYNCKKDYNPLPLPTLQCCFDLLCQVLLFTVLQQFNRYVPKGLLPAPFDHVWNILNHSLSGLLQLSQHFPHYWQNSQVFPRRSNGSMILIPSWLFRECSSDKFGFVAACEEKDYICRCHCTSRTMLPMIQPFIMSQGMYRRYCLSGECNS